MANPSWPLRGGFSKAFNSPIFSLEEGVKVASAAVHLHYKMRVRHCPRAYEVLSED